MFPHITLFQLTKNFKNQIAPTPRIFFHVKYFSFSTFSQIIALLHRPTSNYKLGKSNYFSEYRSFLTIAFWAVLRSLHLYLGWVEGVLLALYIRNPCNQYSDGSLLPPSPTDIPRFLYFAASPNPNPKKKNQIHFHVTILHTHPFHTLQHETLLSIRSFKTNPIVTEEKKVQWKIFLHPT